MAGAGLKGRKVVVVGANLSAIALVKFLIKRGAVAKLVDIRALEVVEPFLAEQLDLTKFTLECGELTPKSFEEAQQIIVTPGFPMDSKSLESARMAGIQVVSELEFVAQNCDEPIVAVAGTNGKSTTAHILSLMLEAQGKTTFTNTRQPLSNYLNQSKGVDHVIAVTNSFQLEGIVSFKPSHVLLLNISEDHAHRYPNFEIYLAANREVLKNADASTRFVMNAQDSHLMGFAPQFAGQTSVFSAQALPEGIEGSWYTKTHLFVRPKADAEAVAFALNNFRLRGSHNKENLAAAALAAMQLGVQPAAVQTVIDTVAALPSRMEFIRRINSVAFYNDACGANVQAALRTLQAFNEPVILISGGRDKNADYTPLIPHIRQRAKNLILVGEAKEKMNRAIGDFTETFLVGTVEEAVILAYQKSRSGDVILFSPACEPTDMFATHEDKGEYFKKLVSQIAQPRRPNVI